MADAELESLLTQYAECFERTDNGRVLCKLNNHTFPPKASVIAAFVGGVKFKRLQQQHNDASKLNELAPFLVPSKHDSTKLWCALTGRSIHGSWESARKHMRGARFKKARERFERDEAGLIDEPDMDVDDGGDADEPAEFWVPEGAIEAAAGAESSDMQPSSQSHDNDDAASNDDSDAEPAPNTTQKANSADADDDDFWNEGEDDDVAMQHDAADAAADSDDDNDNLANGVHDVANVHHNGSNAADRKSGNKKVRKQAKRVVSSGSRQGADKLEKASSSVQRTQEQDTTDVARLAKTRKSNPTKQRSKRQRMQS